MFSPRSFSYKSFLLLGLLNGSTLYYESAVAANWFKLRGTEPGKTPHTIKLFGFVQPTYNREYNDRISGAVGALAGNTVAGTTGPNANGQKQIPGTIAPDRKRYRDSYLRRARLGARGTLLPVSDNIDYFFMTEFADNGVNRDNRFVRVLDASVTFNHLSRGKDDGGLANLGARFRAGQFLFSETSEALSHSTPARRVHVFMPEMTFQNAIRRMASDNGRFNFPDSVPANAARDTGVEVFDWAEFPAASGGPWEFTYAAALGNGTTLDEWNRDDNYRQYYWLSFAKLFDKTRGPRRHDAMLYGFLQKGDITFNVVCPEQWNVIVSFFITHIFLFIRYPSYKYTKVAKCRYNPPFWKLATPLSLTCLFLLIYTYPLPTIP